MILLSHLKTRRQGLAVLGYKGKSGAVPQKVLVYSLSWVSPDFFHHTKKATKRGCTDKNTSYFIWVSSDLWYPPEYTDFREFLR